MSLCFPQSVNSAGDRSVWTGNLPDILLLASNLAILFLARGDGRVFLISIVTAILLRYLLLFILVLLDWRFPGWFAGSRLRRMVKDPSEGGAYEGEPGTESSVPGFLIFLAFFVFLPIGGIWSVFKTVPLLDNCALIIAASALTELRDIAAGKVIYFRSGAGQYRNLEWNFKQLLALALTMLFLTLLIPLSVVTLLLSAILGWNIVPLFAGRAPLWVFSICLLGVFHTLLFLYDRAGRMTRTPEVISRVS